MLKQLREQGITAAELKIAKRAIVNSYPVDLANPSNLASIILDNAISGLSPAEIREFPRKVQSVSMTEVQQVIQQLIHPDNLIIVTASSQETEL